MTDHFGMRLVSAPVSLDGEYVFAVEGELLHAIEPGMVIVIDPDDAERRGFYRITSAGGGTITAVAEVGR